MENKKLDAGMIGLSVMGSNLLLNLCDHGYEMAGYNRSRQVTETLEKEHPHERFHPFYDLESFVQALAKPRKIMIMVKAGAPVDAVLGQLYPLLDEGDIVMDCGNSHFPDTIRRCEEAKEHHIHYFGVGVSGGEEGARRGPAIMPGGNKESYEKYIGTMLEDIAAKAYDGTPCCAFIGENGAGHFVKMVHNGIEYADMQLIAESYLLLKEVGGFSNKEISDLMFAWNESELESYLIEITAKVLREKDPLSDGELIDQIVDSAKQKGTGTWTAMAALSLGVDVSMIAQAGNTRLMSDERSLREQTKKMLTRPACETVADKAAFAETVRHALYGAKIVAYAQGFNLLSRASEHFGWQLNPAKIAGVFRAGCIIRAVFLDEITKAYSAQSDLAHLTHAEFFRSRLDAALPSLREAVCTAVRAGIPLPAFSGAVSYIDLLCAPLVGANLIQGQRDFFGAHTFERRDREGSFHHEWSASEGQEKAQEETAQTK